VLTEKNFGAAIEILKEQFGKPQHIIAGPWRDFMKIPNFTSDSYVQFMIRSMLIFVGWRHWELMQANIRPC